MNREALCDVNLEPRQRAKGAGRKPIGAKVLSIRVKVRATPEELELFKQLGGSSWLRKMLLIAKPEHDRRESTIRSGGAVTSIQARLSPPLSEKFHALGGSAWLHWQLAIHKA